MEHVQGGVRLHMRKWITLLIFNAIAILLVSGCSEQGEKNIKVPVDEEHVAILTVENFYLQKKTDSKQTYFSLVEDRTYKYNILDKGEKMGELTVTTRKLENGDVFLFTKLRNYGKNSLNGKISIKLPKVNRYELNDWDQRFTKHVHNKTTGVDETTNPIGLVKAYLYDIEKYNIVLSKNYISRELVKNYENEKASIVRELISEEKNFYISVNSENVNFVLPLRSTGNDISENWILFSKDQLFENEDNLERWIDYHIDHYQRANSWLTAEGPYKKLPWSIEPATKKGYGRNLGLMQDKAALDNFEEHRERYFYDLVLNSVADLYAYKQKKGTAIWETEYTSTWLNKAYSTKAPYIDTRHNEYIALFLTRVGNLLNIDELKKAETVYGDYLVEQVKVGNTIGVGEGYLIADYFSPYDHAMKTHASMNHILGGVNILVNCYISTGDRRYLDVALNIRKGIEELGSQWIRDSGDIWYQVNPDLTFGGNDYEQLTLIDLLTTQSLFEKVNIKRSEMLDRFIRSKASYLIREKKEIYPYVIDMLKEQGFGDVFSLRFPQ